jgi:tetratricopeptide (TPR) repeat protein
MINSILYWILIAATRGGQTPSPECAALLATGDAAYRKFDNAAAIGFYTGAHHDCPESYEALMKMTRALIDLGEDRNDAESPGLYGKGMRCADTMQKQYPDSAQSWFLKAVAAGNLARLKSGMRKLALSKIVEHDSRKSIDLDPVFAPAYIVLGVYFREVATLGPFEKTMVRIISAGMPAGTLEDSERALLHALALSPYNIDALLELARTEIALGRNGEAIILLQKMQKCPPAWHLDGKFEDEGARLLKQLH